jgi:protein-tyrosine phosphatase
MWKMRPSEPLVPGTHNSRDLGGIAVRGGVVKAHSVIRSDAPVELGPSGQAVLREMGIRGAIDLREPVERRLDPPDFGKAQIEVQERPILEGMKLSAGVTLGEIYIQMLDCRGENLTAVIRRLAASAGTPTIVFCSAGKDRTGIVSGLVLGALGAEDDAIVADYALTERNMKGAFRDAIIRRARKAGITEQELVAKVGSPPSLMRDVLGWLRGQHGGVEGFLRGHGMTGDELATLRTSLVEPCRAQAA